MEPPINASKVIKKCIVKKLQDSDEYTEDEISELSRKWMKKIRKHGYSILMEKYNLDNKKDIFKCGSLFTDYTIMFEKICMAIMETDIIDRLISSELKVEDIYNMSLDEMNPAANEDIRNEITTRQNVKIDIKTSKMYRCKCGGNETLVESKQIRRADEPPTVTARCITCGRKWVVGI